jgi:uncharacterized protein (DUF58 family)
VKERESDRPEAVLAPELMARVQRIQLRTRQLVSSALQGAYRSSFRGSGIEFDEVRPYLPGDDVRSIDWKVTARTGEPFIKTYVEDRTLVLQLVVDTSRSMAFGSAEKSKREAAAEVAALMALVAARNQDQVGLVLFDQEPGLHLAPKKGQGHVLRVIREALAAQPLGHASRLSSVLEDQVRHLKRNALVLVVSDFLGLEDDPYDAVLKRLARRHDVIAIRIFDPLEEALPEAGCIELEGIEDGRTVEVDSGSRRVREAWAAAARERRATLRERLARARADKIELDTTGDIGEAVLNFFRRRTKRHAGRPACGASWPGCSCPRWSRRPPRRARRRTSPSRSPARRRRSRSASRSPACCASSTRQARA